MATSIPVAQFCEPAHSTPPPKPETYTPGQLRRFTREHLYNLIDAAMYWQRVYGRAGDAPGYRTAEAQFEGCWDELDRRPAQTTGRAT